MLKIHFCFTGIALAAISVLGCSSSGNPASAPAPAPTTSSAPAPAPAPTTSSAPAPPPAAPSSPAPSAGLASTQGEFPGITVAVQELKRTSNTLTLKFSVANQSNQAFEAYYQLHEKEAHSVDGIHLIDPVAKKKYFVVRDSDGACLCSRQIQAVAPGGQSVLWAKFPAPPDDVQKMTVEIPHFPPLEDVPVSR